MFDIFEQLDKQVKHYYPKEAYAVHTQKFACSVIGPDGKAFITFSKAEEQANDELEDIVCQAFPNFFSSGYPSLFLTLWIDKLQAEGTLTLHVAANKKDILFDWHGHNGGHVTYQVLIDKDHEDYLDNQEDMIAAVKHRNEFFDSLTDILMERPYLIDEFINPLIGNLMRDLPLAMFVDSRVKCAEGNKGSIVIDYNVGDARVGIRLSRAPEDATGFSYRDARKNMPKPARLRRAMRLLNADPHKQRDPLLVSYYSGDIVTQCVLISGNVQFDYKETIR